MGSYQPYDQPLWRSAPAHHEDELTLGQRRWDPVPLPDEPTHFVDGVRTVTTAGDAIGQQGMAAHLYLVTESMEDASFFDADGELMFVPEHGAIRLVTDRSVMSVLRWTNYSCLPGVCLDIVAPHLWRASRRTP
jgi:homogentisate 1,2-dioxygenase